MNKNETEIEEKVIAKIRQRRDVGRAKYGTTMERQDLTLTQWLTHLQEELMDAAIYVEKVMAELKGGGEQPQLSINADRATSVKLLNSLELGERFRLLFGHDLPANKKDEGGEV